MGQGIGITSGTTPVPQRRAYIGQKGLICHRFLEPDGDGMWYRVCDWEDFTVGELRSYRLWHGRHEDCRPCEEHPHREAEKVMGIRKGGR